MIGKTLPGLMSLNFAVTFRWWAFILPWINGSGCWWCNGVGDIFLAHVGPLSTNWASFKNKRPEYCFWPCPSLYDPSSDGYFLQDNVPCHKAEIFSNFLGKMTTS